MEQPKSPIRWLDRHLRGWGQVEIISDMGDGIVMVRDLENLDNYPAHVRDLKRERPNERR